MPLKKIFFCKITDQFSQQRLDVFLSSHFPQISRSAWQRQITQGKATVDGNTVKPSFRLEMGQAILAHPPLPLIISLTPDPTIPIQFIHRDEHIAVLIKPAGVVVHPGAGNPDGTLVHGLLAHLDTLATAGGDVRPGIVHRLDKDTSGLMVVARSDVAFHSLRDQFSRHTVERGYLFICWGILPDEGEIDTPVARHPRYRVKMAALAHGKPARTRYRALAWGRNATLGMAWLETGRTHQVRVHLASRGHPLVGDAVYGGKPHSGLRRQALHSALLEFVHPVSGEELRYEKELPQDMVRAWRGLSGGEEIGEVEWQV